MKPTSALLGLALLTSCANLGLPPDPGLDDAPVVLAVDGVVVRAALWEQAGAYRSSGVQAVSRNRSLLGLEVHAFEDADADGRMDEGEQRGTWTVESSTPSNILQSAGSMTVEPKDPESLRRYMVFTTVRLADGGVIEAVAPFPRR